MSIFWVNGMVLMLIPTKFGLGQVMNVWQTYGSAGANEINTVDASRVLRSSRILGGSLGAYRPTEQCFIPS
jgi:hypothetical protein